tara:strand:+ start:907 stop:1602 length:696 start_codon:yes stop_codon:yes gene_type:complete
LRDVTFVIYGASSDIISSVFKEFEDSNFISLINRTEPEYKKGKIINTNDSEYLHNLQKTVAEVNKSEILVYLNAAVFQKDELFVSHDDDDIEKMIDVGITKNLFITQVLLQEMLKRRKGRIIHLSSFRAFAPTNGTVIYSAIKAFTNAFSKGAGLEYGRFDITSNILSIGFAQSKLLESLEDEKLKLFKKSISKNKFLPPSEFINSIRFLIQSSYINSSIIDLEGGIQYLE